MMDLFKKWVKRIFFGNGDFFSTVIRVKGGGVKGLDVVRRGKGGGADIVTPPAVNRPC